MHIKIHTKGIKGSGMVEEGDVPSAMFGAILEVDGHMLEQAYKIDVTFEEGFATVTAEMHPSTIEIVSHTKDSWPGIEAAIEESHTARTGMGQAVARVK
jgi:hypothetical protein